MQTLYSCMPVFFIIHPALNSEFNIMHTVHCTVSGLAYSDKL